MLIAAGPISWLPASPATTALVVAGVGFAAGVPHGAIDHLMASRLTGGRSITLVAAAYASLAAAAWALMAWAGPVGLLLIVALSALFRPRRTRSRPPAHRMATPAHPGGSHRRRRLRGVAPAVGPFRRPDRGSGVGGLAEAAVLIGAPWVHVGLVTAWVVAAVLAVTSALRCGHRTVALDVVLVGLLGALAPPLVAFAVWFGGWHALRHCARMLTVEPGCAALIATGRRLAAVRRFAGLAALPSIAALTVVAALGWFTVVAPHPATFVAEVLRLLLALTVPHMVVVLWLDRTSDPQTKAAVSAR